MEKLIRGRRSVRRFQQKKILLDQLDKYVDVARLAPSAANLQPLEYIIIHRPEHLNPVFETLKWAGYIRPLGNPPEKERPVAYIVVLVNTEIKKKGYKKDIGAAIENIILCALADGVGSCWISSIEREHLALLLDIPPSHLISDVIALGYPNENPVAVEMTTGSIEYFKDEDGCLNVPKRNLNDILYHDSFKEKAKPVVEEEEEEEIEIEWVRIFETPIEEEAIITKGFLDNHDIICVMEKSTFHEMPVNFGLLSRTSLLIPIEDRETTLRLLEEQRAQIECPHCQELNFKGGLQCSQCWKPLNRIIREL